MSIAAEGNFGSSRGVSNGRNDGQDHLLVLVHGILARYILSLVDEIVSRKLLLTNWGFRSPKDWTYVEAELKRRLGRNFLIYGVSVFFKFVLTDSLAVMVYE